MADFFRPTERTTPDEWAAVNRWYPPSASLPGQRDPRLTPYTIEFGRRVASRRNRRVVLVCASQMGKSESMLDVIGQRLDQAPAPILYVGPNRQFLHEQFEPRVMALLDEAPTLFAKVSRGKRMTKTRKVIAGVPLRLAHAGSSAALKSDPAALALVDEYDEMLRNVKGQGDPLGLVEARGDTYPDYVVAVTSTPSVGTVETEYDAQSGLEFWKVAEEEDLKSPIWALWQSGTRHHWCWPCPHCGEYFIPRFSLLKWPEKATPAEARRGAFVLCGRKGCGGVIEERHKNDMNERGRYVAPGQIVDRNGVILGDPPDTSTISLWASGLATRFVSFGERAERYLVALASGNSAKIQTAVNAGFGELHSDVAGDVPPWEFIANKREGYKQGTVPAEVIYLTCGVDVQKNRIVYVIRGWGGRASSWLIEHGELWGETRDPNVWEDLAAKLAQPIGGLLIKLVFVDSGFRPGKKFELPLNRVYEFCRRFRRFVFPTKGSSSAMITPLVKSKIEVTQQGSKAKYGLELIRLDPDHWKSFVHERLAWPADQPGAWHLPEDAKEDYCRQIVGEARARSPTGKPIWVERGANHYLDAEALASAAGFMLNVHHLKAGAHRKDAQAAEAAPAAAAPAPAPAALSAVPAKPINKFSKLAAKLNGT